MSFWCCSGLLLWSRDVVEAGALLESIEFITTCQDLVLGVGDVLRELADEVVHGLKSGVRRVLCGLHGCNVLSGFGSKLMQEVKVRVDALLFGSHPSEAIDMMVAKCAKIISKSGNV